MQEKQNKPTLSDTGIERALYGRYDLKVLPTLQQAFRLTIKHFGHFLPANVLLVCIQLGVFFVAIRLQGIDLLHLFDGLMAHNPELNDPNAFEGIFVANMSYEIISAPLSVGLTLMAIKHALGEKTRTFQLLDGLAYSLPIILITLMVIALQTALSTLFFLLSPYIGLVFSSAALLVCDKRIPPLKAMMISFKAMNRKLLPLVLLYSVATLLFLAALVFYGIGLIFVVPFFFHLKAVIYQQMFASERIPPHQAPDQQNPHSTKKNNNDKNNENFFDA